MEIDQAWTGWINSHVYVLTLVLDKEVFVFDGVRAGSNGGSQLQAKARKLSTLS